MHLPSRPSSPSPPVPLLLPLSLLPPLSPSPLFLYLPLVLSLLCPSNPAEGLEERCKLPIGSGRSPAAKRFWCIFRLESALLFHFHNVTFVIFTVHFGCVQHQHNKIPVRATWGRQLFGRGELGAIAHIAPMESAPMESAELSKR